MNSLLGQHQHMNAIEISDEKDYKLNILLLVMLLVTINRLFILH